MPVLADACPAVALAPARQAIADASRLVLRLPLGVGNMPAAPFPERA